MNKIIQMPSPFWNERPKRTRIKSIVLHCSAHEPLSMIKLLKKLHLSTHYVIGTDGRIFQLVPEEKRAWHAGVSHWRMMENLNHYSIGIELSSLSLGQQEYSKSQLMSLERLCSDLMKRYDISPKNIVAHSDIAPTRKADPGKMFPWQCMAAKKIGLWYNLEDADKIMENDISALLGYIGYDVTNLSAASYAFCRHFLPELIKTENNLETLVKKVYPDQFQLPEKYIPYLKACAYQYCQD